MNKLDRDYCNLLQDILNNGIIKKDRTGTGTKSVFGRQIRHKMSDGFPLLTTKKMYFKGVATELIWFLRGDTNIEYLVDNGCHIWDGDAFKNYVDTCESEGLIYEYKTKEDFANVIERDEHFARIWGNLGPIYGKQWRKWCPSEEYSYGEIDQIKNLIEQLKTNPDSRRLIVTAWNVGEIEHMVLPPCHYGFQVYTRELSDDEIITYYYKNIKPNDIWKKNDDGRYYYLSEIDGENMWVEHSTSDIRFGMKSSCPSRAISLIWNQRSVDTFLGLPYNIASYGL